MLDRKRTALLAAIADRKRRMHRSRGLLSVATALLSVLYSGAAADEVWLAQEQIPTRVSLHYSCVYTLICTI